MISLPWWLNPWRRVRNLEEDLACAEHMEMRADAKLVTATRELLDANSRLNLKLSGDDPERLVKAARAAECHER